MLESPFNVSSAPKKARVEIIPLIDVVFFLLATFVLFTLSLEKMRDIDVEMPVVPPTPSGEDFTTLFIQASEGGTYYLKRGSLGVPEVVIAAELKSRLERYRETESDPRVFVRSDGKAKLGDAIYALDQVRLVGIKKVSVETVASRPGS